ncbi:hypothetical protein MMOR_50400 [Mycolicibacterium moriokaense]|jgi:hypothetical protein|uniref:Uncharacterized protein n=1 Tax=Mycolicibacterium moriokaense TaxID=39691 RepID=A0AAD1HG89_9MYCO|nr:hypothetical protein MMOR_50400 [Mycolicibacterium moriokaense]
MLSMNAFNGVRIAGGSWTLHVPAAAAAWAHPAYMAHAAAGAAAAITPQPKRRRTAAATGTSVDRGII